MKNPLIGGVRFINDLFLQDCLHVVAITQRVHNI